MHYPINKQDAAGFTLIELVVVIIVLGILAVIAAPKFIGLSKEARVQTLSQLQASVKTANTLAYSKTKCPACEAKPLQAATILLISTSMVMARPIPD